MKKKISKKNFVSFCVPVYNEEEILIEYLGKIKKGLGKVLGKDNYEIVVVENGSTDSTKQLLNNLMENKVKYYFAEGKGHGNAYKLGIEKAKYEYIVLSAIDIPFGFSDLKNALPRWDRYDILFGSRRHPKSRVIIPWQRKISSFLYNKLLRIFFGVK